MMPDLADWQELKTWVEIQATNTAADALLQKLITEGSAYFLNECNRPNIVVADYMERQNGRGTDRVALRYAFASSPLTAITSLRVNGVQIPAAPDVNGVGFAFDDYLVYLRGYCFSRGIQNIEVSYSAGLAAVPAEVARAVKDMCALWYRRRGKEMISSENMAGMNVVFTTADVPAAVRNVIAQYSRRF